MRFHVISLFPGALDSYIGESIVKRAVEDKKIRIFTYNPRDFADNAYDRIDRKPYGGGPGMVIQALPVAKAIEKAHATIQRFGKKGRPKIKIVFLSPRGIQFDTAYAKKTAEKFTDIIIVCGRYEGIDARVKKMFKMEDVSIGPFVVTGGELGALLMIDCISRQVDGVLGDKASLEETRAASEDVYTRPETFIYKKKKYVVPKVLLSGNHADIEKWRGGH